MNLPATGSGGIAAVDTAQKQRGVPFAPGQSGNPLGRPKGARTKLAEAFVKAMLEDFEENGPATIAEVREEKPDQYLKVIAAILPKEITGEDGGPIGVSIEVVFRKGG